MKQWANIEGFDNYQVSSDGEIRNQEGRLLKPFSGGIGYLQISLFRNGDRKRQYIHRLVADAFCTRPQDCNEVNHKDGNKLNNKSENLEWCSRSDNLLHSCRTLLQHVKPVECIETTIVYSSIKEAAKQTGADRNGIARCCEGKQTKAKNLHWRYAR